MKFYGVIYKALCKGNGKLYIGQTKNFKRRIGSHFYPCNKDKSYFHFATKKYGRENFDFEEVFIAFTKESLDWAEQYFIKQYNTLWPSGMNLTTGGQKNKEVTEELREKFRKIQTELHGKEIIARNINTGKEFIFNSIKEACRTLNIKQSSISSIINEKVKRKTSSGYTFKIKNGSYPEDFDLGNQGPRRECCFLNLETGELKTFSSVSEMASFVKIKPSLISCAINRNDGLKDGYIFSSFRFKNGIIKDNKYWNSKKIDIENIVKEITPWITETVANASS